MEQKENIIYLLPKENKGLLRFIFSRLPFFVLMLSIEISIVLCIFGWFRDYFPYIALIQTVFAIGMVIYLFNCQMDYSAKMTWLFLLMLFPVPGALFLAWTQNDIGHRTAQVALNTVLEKTKDMSYT